MSNIFNVKRFGKLFRKHTAEHFKSYLLSAIVLCAIMTLFYFFAAIMTKGWLNYQDRTVFFIGYYLLSGAIFTSTIFAEYGNKKQSINSLLLPASHFEKFLIGWVYSFLIFTCVFIACFYSIDIIALKFSLAPGRESRVIDLFDMQRQLYIVFYIYAVLHAVMIFGAIFFRKLHFIKTASILFMIFILLMIFNIRILSVLIFDAYVMKPVPFNALSISGKDGWVMIGLSKETQEIYYRVLVIAIPLICWTAAYFKIKEKEV